MAFPTPLLDARLAKENRQNKQDWHVLLAKVTPEIKGQLRLIGKVHSRLQSRVDDGLDMPGQLDIVAYQIHNLYGSVEDLLKLVDGAFENSNGSTSNWYRALLLRMSQPVGGVRPALLSETTFDLLRKLKPFCDMFRRAYSTDLERDLLQGNLVAAQKICNLMVQDVDAFLYQLESSES